MVIYSVWVYPFNILEGGCYQNNVIPVFLEETIWVRSCLQRPSVTALLLKYPMSKLLKVNCVPSKVKTNYGWDTIRIGTEENVLSKPVQQNTLQLLLDKLSNVNDNRCGDFIEGTITLRLWQTCPSHQLFPSCLYTSQTFSKSHIIELNSCWLYFKEYWTITILTRWK